MGLRALVTAITLAVSAIAAPAPQTGDPAIGAGSGYWLSSVKHQGAAAFGPPGHQVFRNVKDFGAKGDGVTDDAAAINAAISAGNRCSVGCDSTTTTPAIVYFPPGTYIVSQPIIQLYYTQLIGDAVNLPKIVATPEFAAMGVIDSDPYLPGGGSTWVNQNNFFRQIRNFVIDISAVVDKPCAGIHWQVAQATSLQNIVFNMRENPGPNDQNGIFMDNGSGGFMADLTFNGGTHGAFFGNQQYTTRNLTFNNCRTAIFMNWNWAWLLQDVKINNCGIGIDMANGGTSQTVGSVLLVDSMMTNTQVGVLTAYDPSSQSTNGTLIMDNVDMSGNVPIAVKSNLTQATILAGNTKVTNWHQGRLPNPGAAGAAIKAVQGPNDPVPKPDALLNKDTGKIFTRVKPQYENVPAANFLSAKSNGCMGDGKTDDTAAIQALLNKATADQVVFFDHGAYLVTDTIKIPKNIRITGEIWPVVLAGGDKNFKDEKNPKPVFQVGQPGESGNVELTDLMMATAGPQPGAVMIEWNVAQTSQGSAGMWDVHTRIGGAAGTQLDLATCGKNPNITNPVKPECFGANMLLHVTKTGSGYFENCWFWVADHDLEPDAKSQQIDIYNGRGVLIESEKGPVWMYGTASEHNVLYNYQLQGASNIFMGTIQTETPYFQGNPDARTPFTINTAKGDPSFDQCTSPTCARAWGLRAVNSKDVFVFGAGLYSFFDNYGQVCVNDQNCQDNMVSIESSAVHLFGLSTKAAVNMLTVDGTTRAVDSEYRSTFCGTMAYFASVPGGATKDGAATNGSQ